MKTKSTQLMLHSYFTNESIYEIHWRPAKAQSELLLKTKSTQLMMHSYFTNESIYEIHWRPAKAQSELLLQLHVYTNYGSRWRSIGTPAKQTNTITAHVCDSDLYGVHGPGGVTMGPGRVAQSVTCL